MIKSSCMTSRLLANCLPTRLECQVIIICHLGASLGTSNAIREGDFQTCDTNTAI